MTALCGCSGPKDAKYAPKELALSGPVSPPDIVPGDRRNSGIFTLDAHADISQLCCWIAPHATLVVRKEHAATVLHLNFYIPDMPAFRRHLQAVTVSLAGSHARETFSGLHPGFRAVTMAVPRQLRHLTGRQLVTLDSAIEMPTHVPSLAYGIVLISVYFE